MTYQTQFPDFTEMPAIPAGWTDTSWRNDASPSFVPAPGLLVWVDYANDEQREFPGGRRFLVCRADAEGCYTGDLLDSDDWSEVLAFIAAQQKAA